VQTIFALLTAVTLARIGTIKQRDPSLLVTSNDGSAPRTPSSRRYSS
jgi:hypothetical protein